MAIEITTQGSRISIKSPYHPDFALGAKKLGGRWDAQSKVWTFDARDESRVRALCMDLFGSDGSPVAAEDMLTIRAPAKVCEGKGVAKFLDRPMSFWLAGREVARAYGRDSGATLGDGVVIISGGFSSGGSVKNPSCTYREGTIFELRDVPRAAAEKVHAKHHGVTLLDAQGVVVALPTSEQVAPPAEVQEQAFGIEIDRSAELATIEREIAELEEKLAGLRAQADQLRGATCDNAA